MDNQDYENDEQRKLRITDPSGNTAIIEPGVKPCPVCNAKCVYSDETCKGQVDMMSDMHLCEKHKQEKHGSPEGWYESVETDKDGPVQRMLGMQGDNVKKSTNWGFEYKDEQDVGENYKNEDSHYTN